jgi:hypothetical protein
MHYYKVKRAELSEQFKVATAQEKKELVVLQAEIQKKITQREGTDSELLYPDPEGASDGSTRAKSFHYVMKKDREPKSES